MHECYEDVQTLTPLPLLLSPFFKNLWISFMNTVILVCRFNNEMEETTMKLNKVRWGIIGCGDVTEVKSGPAFQKIENSELVAVMRRTGELAKDYAERHHVPKWYDEADQLINDPDVDAVYIATPPGSHKEYTIKAAKAGKPVYVEKPMARNLAECEEMIAACETAGVPLYVAY
jgi:predicted dehydrogenase